MENVAARSGSPVSKVIDGSIFDEIIERRDTNSLKWTYSEKLLAPEEVAAGPLPMWVADTDWRAPAPVIDALQDAIKHGFSATQLAPPTAT